MLKPVAEPTEQVTTMTKSRVLEVDRALCIVGAEDFSADGESGVVEVSGPFAVAIVSELAFDSSTRRRMGLDGQPVRISRVGSLEIWCNGFYMEGRGVRGVVHRAARAMRQ